MVSGPSVKDLVPEKPNPEQDGISQIVFAQLFKPGPTEYALVGAGGLKGTPPLPTGYVLFKDLVFSVKTEAISSGLNITVFNLPSVDDENDFKKLAVLHLEDDEMSPSGYSWNEATLFSDTADAMIFRFIPRVKYDSMQPDFKSKRIAAVTNQFGIFAISMAPEAQSDSIRSFTQMEVMASSSPDPVRVGEDVTHKLVIRNNGPQAAAEVNVKEELNPDFEYKSATSSQGTCRQSTKSDGRVLCQLGGFPTGASTTITIIAHVLDNPSTKDGSVMRNDLEIYFKENSADFVEAKNQIFKDFGTSITRKH